MQVSATPIDSTSTSKRGQRLIFVGGPPRSGTTLVQNILDSHADVCGGPEFDNIPSIITLRNMMLDSLKKGRTDVFMTREYLDSQIAEFIESFLLPYADRRQRRLVSEKTPFNVLVFGELLELFPAARLILCVRDPRAIAASMLKVGERAASKNQKYHPFTLDVDAAIDAVQQCLGKGFDVVPHERVFISKYEELVAKPEPSVRRLCDFLAIPFSDTMLHPERIKHEGDKTLDDVWYGRGDYYRAISSVDSEKWRDQLRPEDVTKINAAFAQNTRLAQMGYHFANLARPHRPEAATQRRTEPGEVTRGGPSTWPVIRYLWNIRR